jgi:MFS family permease
MYYGWRIAAASFTILLVIVGIVYYSFPVFYPPLIEEFGWSRTQVTAGFFYSILIVGPIFGISAGFLIDRYGTRRILIAGLVAAGGAFLGFASMRALTAYYLFYFLQSIGYVSAGPIPNQVLISHWFDRMRGRAMGIAYVGIGIGGAVAPVLAQFLVERFGWRTAMLALGGLILLGILPLAIFAIKNKPSELGLCPDGGSSPSIEPEGGGARRVEVSLRSALRTRSFWMILLGSMMSIGAVGGIIQHLQLFLRDQGFNPGQAARVASFLLTSSIIGRLTMGYLADRFSKKYVMIAAFSMVGSAIPVLYFVHLPGAVYWFAFLFGFGMGADYMLIPLVTAECFGVVSLGRLMGVILTADAVGQALTPVVVGWFFDRQRNYHFGFALLATAALAAAFAATRIRTKEA